MSLMLKVGSVGLYELTNFENDFCISPRNGTKTRPAETAYTIVCDVSRRPSWGLKSGTALKLRS